MKSRFVAAVSMTAGVLAVLAGCSASDGQPLDLVAELDAAPSQTIRGCPDANSALPEDFEIVLDAVALPTSPGHLHALQTSAREAEDGSIFYFAKTGLFWDNTASFELIVPEELQALMLIGWGNPGQPAHIITNTEIECGRAEGWSGLPGGFWITEPMCTELIVRTPDNEKRVEIGLGTPCDGQQPPVAPSDG